MAPERARTRSSAEPRGAESRSPRLACGKPGCGWCSGAAAPGRVVAAGRRRRRRRSGRFARTRRARITKPAAGAEVESASVRSRYSVGSTKRTSRRIRWSRAGEGGVLPPGAAIGVVVNAKRAPTMSIARAPRITPLCITFSPLHKKRWCIFSDSDVPKQCRKSSGKSRKSIFLDYSTTDRLPLAQKLGVVATWQSARFACERTGIDTLRLILFLPNTAPITILSRCPADDAHTARARRVGRRRRTTDASRVAFVARGGARRARAPLAGVPRDERSGRGLFASRDVPIGEGSCRAEPWRERQDGAGVSLPPDGAWPRVRAGVAAASPDAGKSWECVRARGRGAVAGDGGRSGQTRRGHAAAREPPLPFLSPTASSPPRGRGLGGGRARGARAHRRAHARPPGPGEGGRGRKRKTPRMTTTKKRKPPDVARFSRRGLWRSCGPRAAGGRVRGGARARSRARSFPSSTWRTSGGGRAERGAVRGRGDVVVADARACRRRKEDATRFELVATRAAAAGEEITLATPGARARPGRTRAVRLRPFGGYAGDRVELGARPGSSTLLQPP